MILFDTLGVILDNLYQNWRNSGFSLFFGDFRCFVVKIELKRYTAEFGTFFVNFYEGFYFENIEIIPPNSLFLQVLKNSISEFKRYTAEFEAFLVNFIVTSKTPNITYTPLRSTPKVSKFCHFGGCF